MSPEDHGYQRYVPKRTNIGMHNPFLTEEIRIESSLKRLREFANRFRSKKPAETVVEPSEEQRSVKEPIDNEPAPSDKPKKSTKVPKFPTSRRWTNVESGTVERKPVNKYTGDKVTAKPFLLVGKIIKVDTVEEPRRLRTDDLDESANTDSEKDFGTAPELVARPGFGRKHGLSSKDTDVDRQVKFDPNEFHYKASIRKPLKYVGVAKRASEYNLRSGLKINRKSYPSDDEPERAVNDSSEFGEILGLRPDVNDNPKGSWAENVPKKPKTVKSVTDENRKNWAPSSRNVRLEPEKTVNGSPVRLSILKGSMTGSERKTFTGHGEISKLPIISETGTWSAPSRNVNSVMAPPVTPGYMRPTISSELRKVRPENVVPVCVFQRKTPRRCTCRSQTAKAEELLHEDSTSCTIPKDPVSEKPQPNRFRAGNDFDGVTDRKPRRKIRWLLPSFSYGCNEEHKIRLIRKNYSSQMPKMSFQPNGHVTNSSIHRNIRQMEIAEENAKIAERLLNVRSTYC